MIPLFVVSINCSVALRQYIHTDERNKIISNCFDTFGYLHSGVTILKAFFWTGLFLKQIAKVS